MAEEETDIYAERHSLRDIRVLVEVPPDLLSEIEAKCDWWVYEADKVVINLADKTTDAYFVVKGKLKVMDYLSEDQQVALAELGRGDCFGELSAIDSKSRSARVITLEPTLLASLSGKEFRRLIVACPEMGLALLKRFSGFIRTLNTRITTLSTMQPNQRIFYELIRMSEPNTQGDGTWIIDNAPNHSEIASWAGTEKEVVAKAIGKLARDGVVVRKNRNLIIKDFARLQRLSEQ